MSSETEETESIGEHPLEELFNMEPGTTVTHHIDVTTPMVEAEEYDSKDIEIEQQFQDIYDHALSAFQDVSSALEFVEGQYKARMMEVANQSLGTALSAVKEKSNMKQTKDKNAIAKSKVKSGSTTNNTLVVADRNELLKSFMAGDKS